MTIKVIAFDVFGTVFDLSAVNREEVKNYVKHIHGPTWQPLSLPESWRILKAFPDAAKGIEMLRRKYTVVTCSNGPIDLLVALSKHNDISWDMMIPIQMNKVYKPKSGAYITIGDLLKVNCNEIMMVTANKTFGDLEASAALGMSSQLIRDDSSDVKTIIQLANKMGC